MADNSTALITGGAGFLGSHMCGRLIDEGHTVICVDRFITGRVQNVAHLLDNPRFTLVEHDITEPIDLEHLLGTAGPVSPLGYVLNLASPASPIDYAAFPIQTLQVGSLGTFNALELAKDHGARFLLSSTSEVYGDPEISPQREDYWGRVNPVGPRSVYDEAKRFSEASAVAYHRVHGLDVRIARIFNTYGPGMRADDGRALPAFMSQALTDQEITVFGDGSQTRSLCYVDDLVEGLYRLMTYDVAPPVIVNLGNPEEVTMLGLAERIVKATGSESQIVFFPLPEDDPRVRCPDITYAKSLLNWEPVVSLSEGIERVIPYFRAELAA